jgi:uncharacterized SAM-binding protein YcdF (DUF218 family)
MFRLQSQGRAHVPLRMSLKLYVAWRFCCLFTWYAYLPVFSAGMFLKQWDNIEMTNCETGCDDAT